MSKDQWGCCVLKTCVDKAEGERLQFIVENIVSATLELVQDAYGNYVVQHVLQSPTRDLLLPAMVDQLKVGCNFSRRWVSWSMSRKWSSLLCQARAVRDMMMTSLFIFVLICAMPPTPGRTLCATSPERTMFVLPRTNADQSLPRTTTIPSQGHHSFPGPLLSPVPAEVLFERAGESADERAGEP